VELSGYISPVEASISLGGLDIGHFHLSLFLQWDTFRGKIGQPQTPFLWRGEMKHRAKILKSMVGIGILCGLLMAPPMGEAAELLVQTQADNNGQVAGGSGTATIIVVVTQPPGGPTLDVDLFVNSGVGVYLIDVFPNVGNWTAGDYHYVVQISKGKKKGSGIGVLTIP
jgi:hypothetical protein